MGHFADLDLGPTASPYWEGPDHEEDDPAPLDQPSPISHRKDSTMTTSTFRVRSFDAVFDRNGPDEPFATHHDAVERAQELAAQGHAHVYVICDHGYAAHCPHACHTQTEPTFAQQLAMAETIPQESDPNPFVRGVALFALLIAFLSVTSPARATELPAFVTNVPAGCTVQRVFEDHSAMGVCAGGYTVGFDPDDGSWTVIAVKDTIRLTDQAGTVHDVTIYYP